MTACKRPKNVCPKCDHRGCERVKPAVGLTAAAGFANAPYKCPRCGATVRYCDLRQLTAEEREERAGHHARMHREWLERNADHCKRTAMEYRAAHRAELNRRRREKYASDQATRERVRVDHRSYYERNKDKVKEANDRYVREHFYEVQMRKKRWALKKARGEKSCGSAT